SPRAQAQERRPQLPAGSGASRDGGSSLGRAKETPDSGESPGPLSVAQGGDPMRRQFGVLVLVGGLLAAVIAGPTPAAAAACESLSALAVPNTTITVAQSVPSGTFSAPSGEVVNDLPALDRKSVV